MTTENLRMDAQPRPDPSRDAPSTARPIFRRLRDRGPVLCLLLVFWLFLFVAHNPFSSETVRTAESVLVHLAGHGRRYTTGPLTDGSRVFQSFRASDLVRRIDLRFDTMARTNRSIVRISLFEDADAPEALANRKPIASCEHDSSKWGNDPQIPLHLVDGPLEKGRTYGILVESSGGGPDDSPSVFRVRLRDPFAGSVFLDGRIISGSLCLRGEVRRFTAVVLLAVLMSLLVAGSFAFFLSAGASPLRDFLLFSVCIGWLHAVATPFPHPLDEDSHHYKASCLSRMMTLESRKGKNLGNELPENYQPRFTIRNAVHYSFYERESVLKSFQVCPWLSHTIPVGHAVPAVSLAISRSFSVPVGPSILIGRLFVYAAYVLLCGAAIRFARSYAPFFAAAALLPMEQWLAGSFSTDPLICGGGFLFAGIVCGTREKDRRVRVAIGWREIALLFAGLLFFSSPKYCGYAPLVLLVFSVPKGAIRTSRQRGFLLVALFATILVLASVQVWLFSEFPYHETRNGDTDVVRQLAFVLANPGSFARLMVSFVVDCVPGTLGFVPPVSPALLASASASSPVHPVVRFVPQMATVLTVLGLFAALFANVPGDRSDRRFRRLCMAAAVAVSFVNIASLYVGFTPVGASRIDGVQPRYFIPQLPLFAIAISGLPGRRPAGDVARLSVPLLALANVLVVFRDVFLSFS